MVEFEKEVYFKPAFDKRNSNPKRDYGIGAMRFSFVLKGKNGASSMAFSTNMYLPETIKEYRDEGIYRYLMNGSKETFKTKIDLKASKQLECWSIDIHSPKPLFKGQTSGKCPFLKGGKCYCDGSYTRAEQYADVLLRQGSEAIWKILEKEYNAYFKKRKQDDRI